MTAIFSFSAFSLTTFHTYAARWWTKKKFGGASEDELLTIAMAMKAKGKHLFMSASEFDTANGFYVAMRLSPNNDNFIAHARTDVTDLAAEVRRMREALERAEQEITADKGGRVWTCLQVIRAALKSEAL